MIEVRVTGTKDTANRMRRRATKLDRLEDELRAEAEDIVRDAYRAAPKDTGRLARALTVERIPGGYRGTIGDVVYGPPIHNGWRARNIRPQPYLLGVARRERSNVIRRLLRKVRRITEHP